MAKENLIRKIDNLEIEVLPCSPDNVDGPGGGGGSKKDKTEDGQTNKNQGPTDEEITEWTKVLIAALQARCILLGFELADKTTIHIQLLDGGSMMLSINLSAKGHETYGCTYILNRSHGGLPAINTALDEVSVVQLKP